MTGTKLVPEKITSPIQLMAAWFAMLILLVSVLLTAAVNITRPDWAAGFLVIFASALTLLVIACVTAMLTVFRPHLQEGKEYAQWLREKNTYSAGLIVQEKVPTKRAARASTATVASASQINRNFRILVNPKCAGSAELVGLLRRALFRAEEYGFSGSVESEVDSASDSASVWVGYRVPANGAVEAIKVAVHEWPHLKYLHLSNDGGDPPDEVHDDLFFGGATSTAKEFGLQPWTVEEIRALPSSTTQADFHRAIRAKYS